MVEFNLWGESFVFAIIYGIIILIPCILVTLIGRKFINELGQWPSKTPVIQMSILWKLIAVEVVGFIFLIGFYQFFSAK